MPDTKAKTNKFKLPKKHGMSKTPAYVTWTCMKKRCQCPSDKYFHIYGGRGIRVCKRWQDFKNFWEDMGPTYKPGLTIDRIDFNGNYEPRNCRWATQKEQQNNRRNNHLITFRGKTLNVTQWAKETGISRDTLSNRINMYGFSVEAALTEPIRKSGRYKNNQI